MPCGLWETVNVGREPAHVDPCVGRRLVASVVYPCNALYCNSLCRRYCDLALCYPCRRPFLAGLLISGFSATSTAGRTPPLFLSSLYSGK